MRMQTITGDSEWNTLAHFVVMKHPTCIIDIRIYCSVFGIIFCFSFCYFGKRILDYPLYGHEEGIWLSSVV